MILDPEHTELNFRTKFIDFSEDSSIFYAVVEIDMRDIVKIQWDVTTGNKMSEEELDDDDPVFYTYSEDRSLRVKSSRIGYSKIIVDTLL